MKSIEKEITGDLLILSDAQYNKIKADNVIVSENITVRFYGVISGSLTLREDSTVYLHGELKGKVINEGGTLYFYSASGEYIKHQELACFF